MQTSTKPERPKASTHSGDGVLALLSRLDHRLAALMVAAGVYVLFGSLVDGWEGRGGSMRMHWAAAGLYTLGGKALLTGVIAALSSGAAWLFWPRRADYAGRPLSAESVSRITGAVVGVTASVLSWRFLRAYENYDDTIIVVDLLVETFSGPVGLSVGIGLAAGLLVWATWRRRR